MRTAFRTRRRLLVVVVGLVASVAVGVPAGGSEVPPGGTFLDDDGIPWEPNIEAIVAEGITDGCGPGLYCPDRSVTRAEAAAFLVRAMGEEGSPVGLQGGFVDVPSDSWYGPYVERLAELGAVVGYPDATFRPDAAVSRAELAAMLIRALPETESLYDVSGEFVDVAAEAWYRPYVDRLRALGITTGCAAEPLRFCPNQPVRRDHMAVFISRAFNLTPITPPARYEPLNGLPATDAWAVHRRVIAVKIDNARGGRPQSGVQEADAMVEVLVEGGLTRWMALLHQSDSSYVGPVRSGRPTDSGLLLPLGATMVVSGGQPWILDQIAAAGVPLLRERDVAPPALFRISSRSAPHNLYADTSALRAAATAAGHADAPPPDLFRWGQVDLGDAPLAGSITLSWSDPLQVTWLWNGSRYLRWMNGQAQEWIERTGGTGQIAADTLVVLAAPVYQSQPPTGTAGSPVPALETVGSGRALVFTQGRVLEGTWERSSWWEPFDLVASDGQPLVVPPGVPWVNVFPDNRTVGW